MGVQYDVIPLGYVHDDYDLTWLEEFGISLPEGVPPSRFPTPREIRGILDQLEGYRTIYTVDLYAWAADIAERAGPEHGHWTTLYVQGFEGDEDQPHPLFFAKGSEELIIRIVEQLAQICGPLIIDNDVDGAPVLVTAGMSVEVALSAWRAAGERANISWSREAHESQR